MFPSPLTLFPIHRRRPAWAKADRSFVFNRNCPHFRAAWPPRFRLWDRPRFRVGLRSRTLIRDALRECVEGPADLIDETFAGARAKSTGCPLGTAIVRRYHFSLADDRLHRLMRGPASPKSPMRSLRRRPSTPMMLKP